MTNKSAQKTMVTLAVTNSRLLQSSFSHLSPTTQIKNNIPWEKLLFQLLTADEVEIPPYAAISALSYGWEAQTGYWVRLDPVELQVDAGNVYMLGRDHLQLDAGENLYLINELNHLLAEDSLVIKQGDDSDWYINLDYLPDMLTTELGAVMGHDIRAFMPTGSDSPKWRKLLAEVQMLFFQNKINQLRATSHKPPVNGVWLWGQGCIQNTYQPILYQAIWHNHSFIKGMLQWMNVSPFQGQTQEFMLSHLKQPGNYLIVADNVEPSPIDLMSQLSHAVVSGQIDQFTLHVAGDGCYSWQKSWIDTLRRWLGR